MRVVGMNFFLILILQVCFTANALDLSPRLLIEDNIVTSMWSQNQNPEPINEETDENTTSAQTQETVEDDDFEVWHESSFLLSSLNSTLLSYKIEKVHRGPYPLGLDKPPSLA